jgi:hypothetical protein
MAGSAYQAACMNYRGSTSRAVNAKLSCALRPVVFVREAFEHWGRFEFPDHGQPLAIGTWGIARVRTRVEHAIGGVKRYRISKDQLRNWNQDSRDQVMETCCRLHNFRLKFRPWHYFSTAL